MTLRSAMRLAKPNGTERSVPYSFFWFLSPKRTSNGAQGSFFVLNTFFGLQMTIYVILKLYKWETFPKEKKSKKIICHF